MKPIDKLYATLRGRTVDKAYITVASQATIYPNSVKVFVSKLPWKKLRPGMELRGKKQPKRANPRGTLPIDPERSLRRTKRKLGDIVRCNSFDLFATFTFKEDRQDINKCRSKMRNWLKSQQRIHGKFNYLIVAEFHPKALAEGRKELHFHALMGGYTGELQEAINPHTNEPLKQNGRQVYTLPGYQSGFTSVVRIDDEPDSQAKVGHYIGKYITKDMPRFPGKKRYWRSHKLAKPVVEDNPDIARFGTEPVQSYPTKRGVTLIFNKPTTEGKA